MPLLHLPIELLDQIISELDTADVTRLMACNNRQLVFNHERRLYSKQDTRDKAMFAACSFGLIRIIRRLVLDYRAPVSSVPVRARPWKSLEHRAAWLGIPESQEVELTLYTTVEYGHLDAFWELLRLGARLDVPNTWHGCLEDLIERVFSPENDWELLHWFYGTGFDAQVSPEAHDYLIRPLLKVIRASGQRGGPPLGALRMLLDRRAGGPLNEVYVGFSPLAAAIREQQYDPIPVLDLLLGAGVSIDGPVCESPIPSPMGIPIFAAVEAIAMRGDTNLVKWCVRNGANINPWQGLTEIAFGHCYATPIRFYLATFDSWAGNPWDPVKGLQLLLDRGAKMDFSPDDVGKG